MYLRIRKVLPYFFFLLCGTAQSQTLDFETLADGTILTTQFLGLSFQNAVVLRAGESLNEFEFPPKSGSGVVSDNGAPVIISFASPIQSFSGYFTYLTALTVNAFDDSQLKITTATSTFNNNLSLSGDLGSSPNERLSVNSTVGISMIEIKGAIEGYSFTMDDLSYVAAVPEPPIGILFALGFTALSLRLLSRREK